MKYSLKVHGKHHGCISNSYNSIGSLNSKMGNYSKALEYYMRALKIKLKTVGEDHCSTPVTY